MASLKAEINNILNIETDKLERDRKAKAQEIDEKFNQIVSLGTSHLKQGSKHKQGWQESGGSDEQLLQEYLKNSDRFKQSVEQANNEKKKIREEINNLEVEVRTLRDQLADRLTENKNLENLVNHEKILAEEKARMEERALNMLSKDLEQQLDAMENSSNIKAGGITPKLMQRELQARYQETMNDYESFIEESEQDLA
jgi:chromosome segregation ATPase